MPNNRRLPRGVVRGQPVAPAKVEMAKHLRREMTPDERLFWNEVRNNRCGGLHFRRQQVILGFIVDFYCDAARPAIELMEIITIQTVMLGAMERRRLAK